MKVYIVLSKGDCETVVNGVFANRKTAEAFMVKEAAEEMDACQIEHRKCEYNNGNLFTIYDSSEYYCEWWLDETELRED